PRLEDGQRGGQLLGGASPRRGQQVRGDPFRPNIPGCGLFLEDVHGVLRDRFLGRYPSLPRLLHDALLFRYKSTLPSSISGARVAWAEQASSKMISIGSIAG